MHVCTRHLHVWATGLSYDRCRPTLLLICVRVMMSQWLTHRAVFAAGGHTCTYKCKGSLQMQLLEGLVAHYLLPSRPRPCLHACMHMPPPLPPSFSPSAGSVFVTHENQMDWADPDLASGGACGAITEFVSLSLPACSCPRSRLRMHGGCCCRFLLLCQWRSRCANIM